MSDLLSKVLQPLPEDDDQKASGDLIPIDQVDISKLKPVPQADTSDGLIPIDQVDISRLKPVPESDQRTREPEPTERSTPDKVASGVLGVPATAQGAFGAGKAFGAGLEQPRGGKEDARARPPSGTPAQTPKEPFPTKGLGAYGDGATARGAAAGAETGGRAVSEAGRLIGKGAGAAWSALPQPVQDAGTLVQQILVGGIGGIPQAAEFSARQSVRGVADYALQNPTVSDRLDLSKDERQQAAGGVADALVPRVPEFTDLAEKSAQVADDIAKNISPATRKAIEDAQITGNPFKGEAIDWGENPNALGYAMQIVGGLASLIPTVATALITRNPLAGGAVGAGMASSEAVSAAEEWFGNRSNEALYAESPFFRKLVDEGMSPADARRESMRRAQEIGALLQGAAAVGGETFVSALVTGGARKLFSAFPGPVGRAAAGLGAGVASGAASETAEGVASDTAIASVDPSKDIGEDAYGNAVLGAAVEGPVGGLAGALTPDAEGDQAPPSDPQSDQQPSTEQRIAALGQALLDDVESQQFDPAAQQVDVIGSLIEGYQGDRPVANRQPGRPLSNAAQSVIVEQGIDGGPVPGAASALPQPGTTTAQDGAATPQAGGLDLTASMWHQLQGSASPAPMPEAAPASQPGGAGTEGSGFRPDLTNASDYQRRLAAGIEAAADKYNLPPIARDYLYAIADVESGFGRNMRGLEIGTEIDGDMAHAGDRAMGPFQFMTATAQAYGLEDRMDPYAAADAAARHLLDAYERQGDWHRAAVGHHSGPAWSELGKWGRDYDQKLRERVGRGGTFNVTAGSGLGRGGEGGGSLPVDRPLGGRGADDDAGGNDRTGTSGDGRDDRPADSGTGGTGSALSGREGSDRGAQNDVPGLEVQEVPLDRIQRSKDVPQFKLGANEDGIVEPLGGTFDRRGVAPVQLWERADDGRLELISGRHRYKLARDSGEQTIPAQIHREADGFTVEQARSLDAELNIRDGQGKAIDYVDYFQAQSITEDQAREEGLVARNPGRRAFQIASSGSPETVAALRADQIEESAAEAIAKAAPGDSAVQAVGLDQLLNKGASTAEAVATMQAVRALYGDNRQPSAEQGDLFGFDDSGIREAEQMGKIAARQQGEIRKAIRAISGASRNPALARQYGVDIKDEKAVNRKLKELRDQASAWNNWTTNPGLMAQVRAELQGEDAGAPAPQAGQAATTGTPPQPGTTNVSGQMDGDITRKSDGKPFASAATANRAAKAQRLTETHTPVELAEGQWVLRPRQRAKTQAESAQADVDIPENVKRNLKALTNAANRFAQGLAEARRTDGQFGGHRYVGEWLTQGEGRELRAQMDSAAEKAQTLLSSISDPAKRKAASDYLESNLPSRDAIQLKPGEQAWVDEAEQAAQDTRPQGQSEAPGAASSAPTAQAQAGQGVGARPEESEEAEKQRRLEEYEAELLAKRQEKERQRKLAEETEEAAVELYGTPNPAAELVLWHTQGANPKARPAWLHGPKAKGMFGKRGNASNPADFKRADDRAQELTNTTGKPHGVLSLLLDAQIPDGLVVVEAPQIPRNDILDFVFVWSRLGSEFRDSPTLKDIQPEGVWFPPNQPTATAASETPNTEQPGDQAQTQSAGGAQAGTTSATADPVPPTYATLDEWLAAKPNAADYASEAAAKKAITAWRLSRPQGQREPTQLEKLNKRIANAEKRLADKQRAVDKPGAVPPPIAQESLANVQRELDALKQERDALVGRGGGAQGEQQTAPDLTLTGETEAERRAREEAEAAKAKADAEAKRKEEERAQADAERDSFSLTGSDRQEDVAGQGALLDMNTGEARPGASTESSFRRKVAEKDGFAVYEGLLTLTKGRYAVFDESGKMLGNWSESVDAAVASAKGRREWEQNVEQNKRNREAALQDLRDRLSVGDEITDDDLDLLNLKPRAAGFEYLSPAIQELLGISKRKVREAMGDALKKSITDMGATRWVANPRRAIKNAFAWQQKQQGFGGAETAPPQPEATQASADDRVDDILPPGDNEPGSADALLDDVLNEEFGGSPAPADNNALLDDVLDEEMGAAAPAQPSAQQSAPRPPRTAGQAATSAASNTAQGVGEALQGLMDLFDPGKGTLGSGPVFNEETYAKAKPHFVRAAQHFGQAGQDIKEVIRAIVRTLRDQMGMTREGVENMRPYIVRFADEVQAGVIKLEGDSATSTVEDAQGSGSNAGAGGQADQSPAGTGTGGAEPGAGQDGAAAAGQGQQSAGGGGVSGAGAGAQGEQGGAGVSSKDGQFGDGERAPGSGNRPGSRRPGDTRVPTEQQGASATVQADAGASAEQLAAADSIPIKRNDAENIAATLPQLFPEQRDDVKKAEQRFFGDNGRGMLFTNGTGTGKTFVGLGVIKRFVRDGQPNVLITVPGEGVMNAWVKAGKALGVDIVRLKDTQDAGQDGQVVITTYANFGQNKTLIDRQWDLLVHDEAHYLSQAADGEPTAALNQSRALSGHPQGASTYANTKEADILLEIKSLEAQMRALNAADDIRNDLKMRELNQRASELRQEFRRRRQAHIDNRAALWESRSVRRLDLSATPFAYEFSVDHAEGFLFDYPSPGGEGVFRSYNEPDGRGAFFIQHFGYRMRYGKLTKPDANVDSGLMQRQFNGFLKNSGALSGRRLTVDQDYSREFVAVDSLIGRTIDEGVDWIRHQSRLYEDGPDADLKEGDALKLAQGYQELEAQLTRNLAYNSRVKLLEAIKAPFAIERARQHLVMGRKVVIFHSRIQGDVPHPFSFVGGPEGSKLSLAVEHFEANRPDLADLDLGDLRTPLELFADEFGDRVTFYNGTISAQDKRANPDSFNADDGKGVIVVQDDAGKEGISLHDTTGQHQRVLMNIGLPIKPTQAIQIEGRIFRVGQASNAVFEYFNTGTNFETYTFAEKISQRASAAENLALGDEARALRDAFVDAFENPTEGGPSPEQGTGGREGDAALHQALSGFDAAKTHYYANQKNTRRRGQREGVDYFATPEPLGLKMVEWAGMRPKETALEPSAGHGAIARYFDDFVRGTFIEPSGDLSARLALRTNGRLLQQTFEDLDVGGNKFDTIVMNPPYGQGGATARDHLAKAMDHLRNGGRIVALIPEGPAADKKFNDLLYGKAGETVEGLQSELKNAKGERAGELRRRISQLENFHVRASISLPSVTFERAGTQVKTRVLILDRLDSGELPAGGVPSNRDISADNINDLFDQIEDLPAPQRPESQLGAEEALANNGITVQATDDGFRVSGTKYDQRATVGPIIRKHGGKWVRASKTWQTETDPTQDLADALMGKAVEGLPSDGPAQPDAGATAETTPSGEPIIEHTTRKGKVIRGVVRTDMTRDEAMRIDQFTFKKNGGWFIRAAYLDQLPPREGVDTRSGEAPADAEGAIRRSRGSAVAERDRAYLDAVERGDMETAQQMVLEAAEASGLPIINEEGVTAYKVRRTAPPKKTAKAYKLFRTKKTKKGEVFALFVGASDPLPQGAWLDAIAGPQAAASKTGKAKVKSKLGPLAYRPGWHAGDLPLATHIGAKDQDGNVFARKDDEVWAEVEMAHDNDYQAEAEANGTRPDGTFVVGEADIKRMPEDGLYRYKTNPNMTGKWIISGSMKINRILSEDEVNAILRDADTQTMPWASLPKGSKIWQEDRLDLSKWGLDTNPARNQKKLLDPVTYDDDGNVIPLSERFNPASTDPRYRLGDSDQTAGGLTPEAVTRFAREAASDLPNAPVVRVFPNALSDGVPRAIQEDERAALNDGLQPSRGLLYDGQVFLFSDYLTSADEVKETTWHEILGHDGMYAVFGDNLNAVLDQVIRARRADVIAKANEYGLFRKQKDGKRTYTVAHLREAAEEVIADLAETRPELGFVQRVIAAIRQWLAERGWTQGLTDNDIIQRFILPARMYQQGRLGEAARARVERAADLRASRAQENPGIKRIKGYLTDQEISKLRADTAQKLLDTLKRLPSASEMAAVAKAGAAKRGWYEKSAEALVNVFGPDAPRFTALLSAMSPQTSVELNLQNALGTWREWVAAGRPTDRQGIIDALGRGVYGGKGGVDSVLDAWVNNSVRALSADDPSAIVLSGPKVHSFFKNLTGETNEVTNDAWIANYALVDQRLFAGALSKSGDPGKGAGYLAMSVRARQAAKVLTKATGETWTPAEVQETIWSWAKALYELSSSQGGQQTAVQLIEDNALTDELIAATPDFRTLLTENVYRDILEQAGYGEQLRALEGARAGNAAAGNQEPETRRQASSPAEEAERRHLLRAAKRLDRLRVERNRKPPADIRFSRRTLGNRPPPTPPGRQGPIQRWRDRASKLTDPDSYTKLIYNFQDRFIDLKRLQKHIEALGATIRDNANPYQSEELYHKRVAKRVKDFMGQELRPLLKELNNRSIELEAFERFLHARHAPEANAVLAERNPTEEMLDDLRQEAEQELRNLRQQRFQAEQAGTATRALERSIRLAEDRVKTLRQAQPFRGTEAERQALSGMSNDEANAVMDALSPEQYADMLALADRVDAINEGTLQQLDRYDLMDRATLNTWRDTYEHYVPLHRDEAHPDSVGHPVGQGFQVRGDAARQRVGSNAKVTNIVAHIAMQREAAITRGEKNRVAKRLYAFVRQHPNPGFWSVDDVPQIRDLDPKTGFARSRPDPTYRQQDNVLVFRAGGKDLAIVFKETNELGEPNEKAMRLARSLQNLDLDDLGALTSRVAWFTRYISSINTQYNPIFGVVNLLRDVKAATLQLSTTPLRGKERDVLAGVLPAIKALYFVERSERGTPGLVSVRRARNLVAQNRGYSPKTRQWMRDWQELQNAGGTTGFRELYADITSRTDKLQQEIQSLSGSPGAPRKIFRAVRDWLSDYNEVLENATRVSAYRVARNNGISQERAASIAKNLTVNFNRKGAKTRGLNAWYAFFNAAVQGTARMAQTLAGPMGRAIIGGGIMLGVVNTLVGMLAISGEDEDGEDDDSFGAGWEAIPDFVRERNFIIPIGGQRYLTLPMPLGYHVLPNIGRFAVESFLGTGGKTPGERGIDMLAIVADAFNPLGGTSNLALTVTPTPFDIPMALAINRDWTDRPIARENFSNLDPEPGYLRKRDSATPWSEAAAYGFNYATGGTDFQPGFFSPTPDQLDYVIGQLTGGVGREISKAATTAAAPFNEDELPPYKIPLVGRFYGSVQGQAGQADLFYRNVERLNGIEREVEGRLERRDPVESIRAYIETEPLAQYRKLGSMRARQVSKLRKLQRDLKERRPEGWREKSREIDKRITRVMAHLNQAVRSSQQER